MHRTSSVKKVIIRTLAVTAALFASSTLSEAKAVPSGLGIGIIAGEPSGVSFKNWINNTDAIDAALAVSLTGNNPFQFHADYLIHDTNKAFNPPEMKGSLPWYYGIGGRIRSNNGETSLGIRVPIGMSYLFADAPLDFFAELAPVLDISPRTNLYLNGAIGLRYYFK